MSPTKTSGSKPKKGPKRKPSKSAKKKKAPRFTAATADKHELYQYAVQSPEEDVDFLDRVYRATHDGRRAGHFREDFCGTALVSAHWVNQGKSFSAEGFDNDPSVLAWGREKNVQPLGKAAERLVLHEKDVRAPSDVPPDIRSAHNFSWCIFKKRAELLEYFKLVHEDLAEGGIFTLDIHGGPEAMEEMEEEREIEEGFEYVWDQDAYWPVSGECTCHIHFHFRDGSKMERAFSYEWRLWGLPEVIDVLTDAGFSKVDTYWEGTDEDGESGNGEFELDNRGENCMSWITYVVARK